MTTPSFVMVIGGGLALGALATGIAWNLLRVVHRQETSIIAARLVPLSPAIAAATMTTAVLIAQLSFLAVVGAAILYLVAISILQAARSLRVGNS